MTPTYKALPFTKTKLDTHLTNLHTKITTHKLDKLILSTPKNLYYLTNYNTTNFHSFFQIIIIANNKKPTIFTHHLKIINFENTTHQTHNTNYQNYEKPTTTLATLLKKINLAQAHIDFKKLIP